MFIQIANTRGFHYCGAVTLSGACQIVDAGPGAEVSATEYDCHDRVSGSLPALDIQI